MNFHDNNYHAAPRIQIDADLAGRPTQADDEVGAGGGRNFNHITLVPASKIQGEGERERERERERKRKKERKREKMRENESISKRV